MDVEIDFRLDPDGRTVPVSAAVEGQQREKRTINASTDHRQSLDYRSKTVQTEFVVDVNTSLDEAPVQFTDADFDDLLLDAEITDCGLMPRTFWVPASADFSPRFSLEQMALDVFKHHVGETSFDDTLSGAEWWIQIRPSPPVTGRYSMHDKPDENAEERRAEDSVRETNMAKDGISFHWDKDEDLRLLCGGDTYVHPHLSTVTYLTGIGAPTVVFNCRVNNFNGEWIVPAPDKAEAFLSWPHKGKHLSFDGRFLHAAPSDLMEDGAFQRQQEFQRDEKITPGRLKVLERQHRRVTFLVNVWLGYKPFNVNTFPETMVSKMSGRDKKRVRLSFLSDHKDTNFSSFPSITINKDAEDRKQFTWPMGDCGSEEVISVGIPLGRVRQAAANGDNLYMKWTSQDGIIMSTGAIGYEGAIKRQKVDT